MVIAVDEQLLVKVKKVVLELVSAAIMTGGIAIMALGHYDTFNQQADIRPVKDTKPINDSKSKVAGAA